MIQIGFRGDQLAQSKVVREHKLVDDVAIDVEEDRRAAAWNFDVECQVVRACICDELRET